MKHTALKLVTIVATIGVAPLAATPGKLGTLPLGNYVCSEPGDAAGAAWVVLPGKNFTIGNGSTYHTADGSGTYLLTGKNVTFTRGPMKGMRFTRSGNATLRWIDDAGKPGRIRCVRQPGRL